MSTWVFSSRPKKLFLANFNPRSSKCFAGIPSTLQKVLTELFLLCLYCPIGFLNMNVYVSSPETHYKLREDKESILTSTVTQTSFITIAINEEFSHWLAYLHKTFVH